MKKYVLKRWRENLSACLVLCLHVVFVVLYSFALMHTVDSVVVGDMNRMLWLVLIQIIFWGLATLCWYQGSVLEGKAHRKMDNDVRSDISKVLMQKNFREYEEHDIGDYISWYNNDVRQISILGFNSFYALITAVFTTAISAMSLLAIHWLVSLSALFGGVLLVIIARLFEKEITHKSTAMSGAYENFCNKMKNILSGFSVMKSFNVLNRFAEDSKENSDELGGHQFEYTLAQCKSNGTLMLFDALFQIAIICASALLIINGHVKVGAIVAVGNFVKMVFDGLTDVLRLRNTIVAASPYINKFQTQLDNQSLNFAKLDNLPTIKKEIVLQNICYSYQDKPIVTDVSFRLKIGGKYALIGSSGSGKTTLMKILAGHLDDYDGRILFDAYNMREFSQYAISSQIAYIEQQTFLFNTSILNNITLWNDYSEEALKQALIKSSLFNDIGLFENGLETLVGENGKNLSGGQRQRIAIARALFAGKKILFVDEGTSALDSQNASVVENCLLENQDLTLLMISHHLSSAQELLFSDVFTMENLGVAAL